VYPRAVETSVAVQEVGQHVTHAHPMFALSRIYRKGMFVVCCVHDNNVAGFNNDVALNLDLRTLDVGGYYVPATGK